MDTIGHPSTISIDQFKEICDAASTVDDQLDRYWQYQCEISRNIEHLLSKGARLPSREHGYLLNYGVALVIRAAHGVAETARE